ncbi:MAG: lysoplasmalogenase [Firmicutes bacterium]|nr:lysoplasmalogenase [Bacillota bacterium]
MPIWDKGGVAISVALLILALAQLLLLGWGFQSGLQIVSGDPQEIRLPLPARVVLSLSLLLSALLTTLNLRHPAVYLILAGMLFSFLGDMFNAAVIPLPIPRLGGMAAFAIAHPFYIASFSCLLKPTAIITASLFWTALAAFGLLIAIGWHFFLRNPEILPAMNAGSLIYALLIGTMAVFAFALGLKMSGWWWMVFLGALLFCISDMIIGISEFGGVALKKPHLWIWLTYIPGQMGIIYGIWMGLAM